MGSDPDAPPERSTFDTLFHLVILSAPLLVYGFDLAGTSVRLSRVVLLVLAIPFVLRVVRRPELVTRNGLLVYAILPFLAYSTFSLLWAPATGGGLSRLGGLVEVMLIYTVMLVADLRAERFLTFAKYYVLSAVIPSVFAVWQFLNNIFEFSPAELPFQSLLIENKYELLEGRVFLTAAGSGFSRTSSTFAEPVIFSSYVCAVLLMSLVLQVEDSRWRKALRLFQGLLLALIVLSVSKLAIISLVLGVGIIAYRSGRLLPWLLALAAVPLVVAGIVTYLDAATLFDRLFIESGHLELLGETVEMLPNINYVFGEGIGGIIEGGSTHRFVISRVFEAGLVGLFFAIAVSLAPLSIFALDPPDERSRRIRNVLCGVIVAILFGLNSYDFFIHVSTWVVIGAVMSFRDAEREEEASAETVPASPPEPA
jgi:uncharacterized membrane protein YpjA